MDWFIKFLQASGPFTMPLCVGMAAVITYMAKALTKMETRAETAEKDATNLRERRAEELSKAAMAMGEFGEKMRDTLRVHDGRIGEVLDLVKDRSRR